MKLSLRLVLVILLFSLNSITFAQENKQPFTKDEILRLLKPVPGKRVEQGDLAGEIAARGIAFKIDEKTLEEFRKAGARVFVISALQQAAEDATRPKIAPGSQTEKALENVATDENLTEAQIKKLPLWEQARRQAADFMEDLPNFIVNQFVSRYVRTPEKKDWQEEDKLEIELTYRAEAGEKFKLLKINGRPTSQSYESIKGATSTGEFGSMLSALFSTESKADFKEIRKEDFHGSKTALYEFSVKKANSAHTITDKTSGKSVVTAYQGSVWIDLESARVLRIEQSATDIQRGFPINVAEGAVEYDWITVSGKKYMMPIYAEVILGSEADRFYSRNVIEMRNYRIFETDVKMILEEPPPKN